MSTKTFLNENDKIEIQGSGKKPYLVRKIGGVVDCSCPAWRNLGGKIDNRVCKHIKANIDPECLLPQAQAAMGYNATGTADVEVPIPAPTTAPRLTKTGKVSTAVVPVIIRETAPPVLLAHKWEGEDPTGWLMSPKMDGVRAVWDGTKFLSRLGNEYHAPDSFKDKMPKLPKGVWLDGELFAGNRQFQRTVSVVRKLVPDEEEWQDIGYYVFDIMNVGDKPFEERLKMIDELWDGEFADDNGWEPVEQAICEGPDALKRYLREMEEIGGEGVMLRKPGSMYEAGRSNTLLKVKSFFDDEALVTGYTPGKGKYKGLVGALVCDWNGMSIEVGTGLSDEDRRNPPKIGSWITFRYFEKTIAGAPRFAVFVARRDYE